MYSRAKILGHPIHPMLVGFPIAFYTATLVAYVAYAITGHTSLFHIGVVANCAGVAGAALAAIPGFIDWAFGVPTGHPAKITGLKHVLLNVGALSLFTLDAILQLRHWDTPLAPYAAAVSLAGVGMAFTFGAGVLGWTLVGKHHVGVQPSREQQRLEISRTGHPSRP
ncbi:MAG: DUF2231 domain-containing protein [Polyangiaceae bacterium]